MYVNISLAVAAVLSGLFAVFLLSTPGAPRTPRRILAILFALVSVQFVLATVQMNGVAKLIAARPVIAMIMAPLLYLHLATAAREDASLRWRDAAHGLGPLAMLLAGSAFGGRAIDLLGLLGVAGYLVLLISMGGGAKHYSPRGPRSAQSLARWRWVVIALLGAMLIADSGMILDMARIDDPSRSPVLFAVSVVAGLALTIGLLFVLHRAPPLQWLFEQARRSEPGLVDDFARLQAHMESRRPWAEPDLSVARLGRQIGLPQRAVSAAVNQFAGRSFSRWVNSYRVRAAKARIEQRPDLGILEIMLEVGFQTKSNFNRAFREEAGMTPTEWRAIRSTECRAEVAKPASREAT